MEEEQWHVGPSLTVQADGITDVEIRMYALTCAIRSNGDRPEFVIVACAREFERYLRGDDVRS